MVHSTTFVLATLLFAAPPEDPPASSPEPPTMSDPSAEAAATGESPAPEVSAPPPPAGPDATEIAALAQEAERLRADLFAARARVSTVTSKLFSARVTLELRGNLERFYAVTNFTVTLDGSPVYFRAQGMPPSSDILLQAWAAPGSHELGLSADLTAKRQSTYHIGMNETFTIVVPADHTLRTRVDISERGNMFSFDKKHRGQYRLTTGIRTRAKPDKNAPKPKQAKVSVKP